MMSLPDFGIKVMLALYNELANFTEILEGLCESTVDNCTLKNLGNLNEKDKFLETHKLSRLNHKEMENLKRWITSID